MKRRKSLNMVQALDAIDSVFSDTSVRAEQTLE